MPKPAPHRPQRFAHPVYVVTTLPPPTAHRLHSSAIVPTWPPFLCPPPAGCPATLRRHHHHPHCPHRSPPSLLYHCPGRHWFGLCHCPHLAGLGSGFSILLEVFRGFQCVPKPHLYVVTTLPPPTAHRRHSSAIVPTWPPLVRSLPLSHLAALGWGFEGF